MKYIWLLLILVSCVEYRLTRADLTEQYIGWANTKPQLDPKMGPKTKCYLLNSGDFRPYIGGEIVRKEELLIGLGVIYYASNQISWEIGYRDSVYKDTTVIDESHKDSVTIDPWKEMNPVVYFGGVLRF